MKMESFQVPILARDGLKVIGNAIVPFSGIVKSESCKTSDLLFDTTLHIPALSPLLVMVDIIFVSAEHGSFKPRSTIAGLTEISGAAYDPFTCMLIFFPLILPEVEVISKAYLYCPCFIGEKRTMIGMESLGFKTAGRIVLMECENAFDADVLLIESNVSFNIPGLLIMIVSNIALVSHCIANSMRVSLIASRA